MKVSTFDKSKKKYIKDEYQNNFYLANLLKTLDVYLPCPKLCFEKGFIFICLYVSVCLCPCVSECGSIISKNYQMIMEFGRMLQNDQISADFKDENNPFIRTGDTDKLSFFTIFIISHLLYFFTAITSFDQNF